MFSLFFLGTYSLADEYVQRKRNVVPAKYCPENQVDEISNIKNKIIKLELSNNTKKTAIEKLAAEIGLDVINLSDSEVNDEQEMLDDIIVIDGDNILMGPPGHNRSDQLISMPTASNPPINVVNSSVSFTVAPNTSNTIEPNLSDGDMVDALQCHGWPIVSISTKRKTL